MLRPRHWEVITSMIGQELDLEDEESETLRTQNET